MSRRGLLSMLGAAVFALATLGGCGEISFSADQLVEDLNDAGASLSLGARLPAPDGTAPIYALEVGKSGTGSVVVFDGVELAESEFSRCDNAGLVCFRAQNTVISFLQIDPESQGKLETALRAIAG